MTIEKWESKGEYEILTLDYPNEEVKQSMSRLFLKDIYKIDRYIPLGDNLWKAIKALNEGNIENDFKEESVIWDFIGGEPFLEIDLIEKICDYIKMELFRRDHHWFNSYRFSFSTNGINYHEDKVQRFIEKNRNHLSIGITIDGTRQKHDLNRVYKNTERGSYDDVVRNIPLWQSQFPGMGTKVTISSADLPYIKESVLHLFSLGIPEVNINCVFEDVWKDGDDLIFQNQLISSPWHLN